MSIITRFATIELERKADAPASRFPATLSTETPVPRRDKYGKSFNEVLAHTPDAVDLTRAPLPLIESHDRSRVNIGVVENLRVVDRKLKGDIVLGSSSRARELAADIGAGIVTGLSIGYAIDAATETDNGDTLTATRWTPFECSIVSVPADVNSGINRSAPNQRKVIMDPKNENETKIEDMAAQERERCQGIRRAIKFARLETGIAERMISDGTSLSEARAVVFDMLEARSIEDCPVGRGPDIEGEMREMAGIRGRGDWLSRGHGITMGRTHDEKVIEQATNAILYRAGVLPMLATVAAGVAKGEIKTPGVRSVFKGWDPDVEGNEMRGLNTAEMARQLLELRGFRTGAWSKDRVVGEALVRSGPYAGTSDFAVILENVLHKVLLGAYAQQSDTWRLWCGTDTVSDFRGANRYRIGSFGALDAIGENGEFRNKAIPDGTKFQITAQSYGNMLGVSRKALVNDDMGALIETIGKFGRSAGLSIEKAAYAVLAQNGGLGPNITVNGVTAPLFDAAWGNVGIGAALSMASIEADRVLMASQKDLSNNEFLSIKPKVLLCPESISGDANALNRSKFDPTAGTAFERPNVVGGLFSEIVGTPRLSGTRRYMFADPGQAAAVVVAFLDGQQAPFMDQQLGWRTDGTEFKIRLDFGVNAMDPKAGITNAGA